MKKILSALFLLLVPALSSAASTGTIYSKLSTVLNTVTGRPDYINNISSVGIESLMNVSSAGATTGDVLTATVWAASVTWRPVTPTGGSGGGGGSLKSFMDSASGVALSSMNFLSSQITRTTSGSSATFVLNQASVTLQGNSIQISTVAGGLQSLISAFNDFAATASARSTALSASTATLFTNINSTGVSLSNFITGVNSSTTSLFTALNSTAVSVSNFQLSANSTMTALSASTTTLFTALSSTGVYLSGLWTSVFSTYTSLTSTAVALSNYQAAANSTMSALSVSTASLFTNINSTGVALSNLKSVVSLDTATLFTAINSTGVRLSNFELSVNSTETILGLNLSTRTQVWSDEGSPLSGGNVTRVDCSGSAITCTQSGSSVTVTVSASGGSSGASSLAIATGSVIAANIVSSPTAVINLSSGTFFVKGTGGATAYISLDFSSVTAQGDVLAILKTTATALSALKSALSLDTATLFTAINSTAVALSNFRAQVALDSTTLFTAINSTAVALSNLKSAVSLDTASIRSSFNVYTNSADIRMNGIGIVFSTNTNLLSSNNNWTGTNNFSAAMTLTSSVTVSTGAVLGAAVSIFQTTIAAASGDQILHRVGNSSYTYWGGDNSAAGVGDGIPTLQSPATGAYNLNGNAINNSSDTKIGNASLATYMSTADARIQGVGIVFSTNTNLLSSSNTWTGTNNFSSAMTITSSVTVSTGMAFGTPLWIVQSTPAAPSGDQILHRIGASSQTYWGGDNAGSGSGGGTPPSFQNPSTGTLVHAFAIVNTTAMRVGTTDFALIGISSADARGCLICVTTGIAGKDDPFELWATSAAFNVSSMTTGNLIAKSLTVNGAGAGTIFLTQGSSPAAPANTDVIWADSSNWPFFNPNSNQNYKFVGSSGSVVPGHIAIFSTNGALTDGGVVPVSGGGTPPTLQSPATGSWNLGGFALNNSTDVRLGNFSLATFIGTCCAGGSGGADNMGSHKSTKTIDGAGFGFTGSSMIAVGTTNFGMVTVSSSDLKVPYIHIDSGIAGRDDLFHADRTSWTVNATTIQFNAKLVINGPLDGPQVSVSTTPSWYQFSVSSNGYVNIGSSGPIHTASTCGSSPGPIIRGGGNAFDVIPGGTAPGACTITFGVPFCSPPVGIQITQKAMSLVNAMSFTATNTAMTVTQTAVGQFSVFIPGPGNLTAGCNQ